MASGGQGEVPLSSALSVFADRADPGAPLTASEVAEALGCARRTAYNKLERLADRGELASKKVGARARVWWRPADARDGSDRAGVEAREADEPPPSFFEAVLESLSDAIFVFDRDGSPIWWNDRVPSLSGYHPDDVDEMGPTDFVADGDEAVVAGMIETVLSTGEVATGESRLDTADGDRFPIELRASRVTDGDGRVRALVGTGRDLTERKRLERSLREERDRFAALFEAIREPIVRVRFEAGTPVIADANPAFESAFDLGVGEHDGDPIAEHVDPADEDGEGVSSVLAGDARERASREVRLRTADGDRDFLFRSTPVEDGAAGAEAFWLFVDVTEQRERERTRREYEAVIEAMRESTFVVDRDLRVSFVNDRMVEATGLARADIVGRSLGSVLREIGGDGTDPEAVVDRFESVLRGDGEEARIEIEGSTAPRGPYVAEIRAVPIDADGERAGVVGVSRDVTDRVKRERELERYEAMLDRSGDMIYATDADGRLTAANDAVLSHLDRTREAAVGTHVSEFLSEEAMDGSVRAARRLLDGEEAATYEMELEDARGTRFTCENNMTLLPAGPDGEFRGTVGVVRDISDRKERERALERLHDATTRLMDATTREEVARIGTRAADSLLGLEVASFYAPDRDGEALSPLATTGGAEELFGSVPTIDLDGSLAGSVLETGEPIVTDDVSEHPGAYNPDTPVRSELIVPAGDHGVFLAASTEVGAFSESDESLAKILVSNVRAALDRARRESLLRERGRELERYETMVNRSGDMIYATDADGRLTAVNDATVSFTGYDREELLGSRSGEYLTEETATRPREAIADLLSGDGEDTATYEFDMPTADGEVVPCEDHVSLLPGGPDGGFRGTVGVIRDISDRKERERVLGHLHAATRRFMDATDRTEVAEIVVETADELLDLPMSAVWLLDGDDDVLRPAAWTDTFEAVVDPLPSFTRDNSISGRVFETGEPAVLEDVSADPDRHAAFSGPHSAIILPLSGHGVANFTSADTTSLDDVDVASARILAANAEAAFDRAEREEEREAYRRELERQRDELSTLNRINALIEDIFHSLVTAESRAEIDRTVCRQLSESPFYEGAWIAERAADGEGLVPRASEGMGESFAEVVAGSAGLGGGVDETLSTGSLRTVHSMEDDPVVPEAVRAYALERGYRSAIVSPLAYADTVYGALVVNAARKDAFSEREQAAFETLGRAVGFAINAINNRSLLLSDAAVELEFRVDGPSSFFARASDRLQCTISLEGTVPVDDGAMIYYLSIDGAASADVHQLVDGEPAISEPRVLEDTDDGCVLQCRVEGASAVLRATEYGAAVRRAVADRGEGELVVRIAPDVDVRDLVADLRSAVPEVRLVGKRRVDSTLPAAAVDRSGPSSLTDRQRSTLRAAFHAGYFDYPRRSTGQEVAASLDIAPSTFHQHMQAAQRKVLAGVFDAP